MENDILPEYIEEISNKSADIINNHKVVKLSDVITVMIKHDYKMRSITQDRFIRHFVRAYNETVGETIIDTSTVERMLNRTEMNIKERKKVDQDKLHGFG